MSEFAKYLIQSEFDELTPVQNFKYIFHMNAFDEVKNLTKPNITINFKQREIKFYRNVGLGCEWLPPGQTLTEDLKSVGRRMAVLAAGDVACCRPTI
jgi:hypothetical protein